MTGTSPITSEESFLLQSHALLECIENIGKIEGGIGDHVKFSASTIYGETAKRIRMTNPEIPIFQGQGSLLAFFYLLLVLPMEFQRRKSGDLEHLDFSSAEQVAQKVAISIKSNYRKQKDVLHHFRNALSHGRVSWSGDNLVIKDEYQDRSSKSTQEFSAEFDTAGLGKIAVELDSTVSEYIGKFVVPRS